MEINSGISLGHFSSAWFVTNASHVLRDGQIVYLKDDSGLFKKGDGVRTIGALPWLGGGSSTIALSNTKILVGNASNEAAEVSLTLSPTAGSFSLSNTGVLTMPDSDASTRGLLSPAKFAQFEAKQNPLGYTPENVSNKSTSVTTDQTSDTKYPSVKSVFDWATSVFTTASAVATQIMNALSGYATQAWVTSQGYLTAATASTTYAPISTTPKILYQDTTNSAAITGNTNNNIAKSFLIPANTVVGGNILELLARSIKTGASNISTLRFHHNTTNSLSGATQIGIMSSAVGTSLFFGKETIMVVKSSTSTEVALSSFSTATDRANLISISPTSLVMNWTTDVWIIIAIQNASSADSTIVSFVRLIKT